MKTCPECKKLIEDNLNECPNCGYPFKEDNLNTIDTMNVDEQERNVEVPDALSNSVIEDVKEENKEIKDDNVAETTNVEENIDSNEIFSNEQITLKNQNKKISKTKIILGIISLALIGSLIGNMILYQNNQKITKQYTQVKKELEKSQKEFDKMEKDNKKSEEDLATEIAELTTKNTELETENEELKNGASKQLVDIKNAYEKGEWQSVVDLSAKLHEKYNGTPEDSEAQTLAQNSQAKIDEAAAAKAAEEAKGYETGITYDQLARTPDEHKGKKVKFSGKVLQVSEGILVTIRLAINDNYDTVIMGQYLGSIVSSRVLEGDHITIYGTSDGIYTYEAISGASITVPLIDVEKIDF